jgi:hypothetical protein
MNDALIHIARYCDDRTFLNVMQTRKRYIKLLSVEYKKRFGHSFKIGRRKLYKFYSHNVRITRTSFCDALFTNKFAVLDTWFSRTILGEDYSFNGISSECTNVHDLYKYRKQIVPPKKLPLAYKLYLISEFLAKSYCYYVSCKNCYNSYGAWGILLVTPFIIIDRWYAIENPKHLF